MFPSLSNGLVQVDFHPHPLEDAKPCLFAIQYPGLNRIFPVASPCYSFSNKETVSDFAATGGPAAQRAMSNGGTEYQIPCASQSHPELALILWLRMFPQCPVVRWRLELRPASPVFLSKPEGRDQLTYLRCGIPFEENRITEVRLSEFDTIAHTFAPDFVERDQWELEAGLRFGGPILMGHQPGYAFLCAYEHGSESPDWYLDFGVKKQGGQLNFEIAAVKGNYFNGQQVSSQRPLRSVWFHLAAAEHPAQLLEDYRTFFLRHIAENTASRTPYIFYNTWNAQERNHYFNGRPYLETLNLEHTLQEIDIAHRMGVDVFVIDTGWYNKTGDWVVDHQRFPDLLKQVKERLDGYGMKLGLWFNPIVAAKTSQVFQQHPEYVMTMDGEPDYWGPIWETEESYGMCLASGYADYFIQKLISLYQTLGVSYFKWDAISQRGCNSLSHLHGGKENSREESADCYAYQMGLEMIRVVEEVSAACPEVIVDFDITEAGRFVGLGFLSVGKYFLINNGPYYHSFDIPSSIHIEPNPINVFFFPGPARSRVCRKSILFDKLIPSVLFLTHFLPDKPLSSQQNAIASMLLGGNGIWGDLFSLEEEDIALFGEITAQYKEVREDITASYPRIRGVIGGSPEIYEKLNPNTGRGMVVFFTKAPAAVEHITQPIAYAREQTVCGADEVEIREDGCLILRAQMEADSARVIFIR